MKTSITQMDILKMTRKADRNNLKETGEFHRWITKTNVHTDKKKQANKKACRTYKLEY